MIVRDAALEGVDSREESSLPKSTRVAGRFQRAGCLRGAAEMENRQREVAVDEFGDEFAAKRDGARGRRRRRTASRSPPDPRRAVGPAGGDVEQTWRGADAAGGGAIPRFVQGGARTSHWTGPAAGTVGLGGWRNLRHSK